MARAVVVAPAKEWLRVGSRRNRSQHLTALVYPGNGRVVDPAQRDTSGSLTDKFAKERV